MGNHEYCTDCGASDFHTGMSCEQAYPERWAAKEKERKAKQAIIDKETARVDKLVKATLAIGGKKGIVNRLLKIREEEGALRKHCPHPKKYIEDGFMYVTCTLCYEVDI